MIGVLLLAAGCSSYSFAEETFVLKAQTEDTSMDFLEAFNEEEKCIILAFEHQLDTFAGYYVYHYATQLFTGTISPTSSVSLWDVGSIYYNSQEKTLEGFLEYIIAPSRNFKTNQELSEEGFKEKVRKDYNFVKKQREREKEENEFSNLLLGMYRKLRSEPKGREWLKSIEREIGEEK